MRMGVLPPLTSAELAEAGQALFGAHWRMELARAFGLEEDGLVRAVEDGKVAAPADWRARLVMLAQEAALRALDTASSLLACEKETQEPAAFIAPRLV